jgi:hypothetical protein
MKTFIFSVLLVIALSTSSYGQDCASGTCSLAESRLAKVSNTVVDTAKSVVVSSANVVRSVAQVPQNVVKSNQTRRGYKLFSRLGNRCR